MSKNRTSAQFNDGDQTTEVSSSVVEGQDEAICANVTSASAPNLLDIPMDILQYILIKAVVLEAKDLKLAKRAWIRKADGAVSRLKTVCSKWSYILTTGFCQIEIHRILESSAQVPIYLEKLDGFQMALGGMPLNVTTTEDELYLYCSYQYEFINVYNRNNLREVTDVLELPVPKEIPQAIGASSFSNCVYVLSVQCRPIHSIHSVFRITKDGEHQFQILPWVRDLPEQNRFISVSANGSIFLTRTERPDELVSIYNSDGSLHHQLRLSLDLFRISNIVPKSSGNLILIISDYELKRKLTEIDLDGDIVRQYQSSLMGYVSTADSYDRILIVDKNSRMELLDSELNLMDVTLPKEPESLWAHPRHLHYDKLRNEILMIHYVGYFGTNGNLSTFTFKEDI